LFSIVFKRWQILLKAVGIGIPYSTAYSLGMLGQFFSAVIPGTVGGDLVKAVYIARRFPSKKLKVVSTIFVDRVVGLSGMIVLAGLAYLLGRPALSALNNQHTLLIALLGQSLVLGAVLVLAGLALFTLAAHKLPSRMPSWVDRLPAAGAFHSFYDAGLAYRETPSAIWKTLGISLCVHCANISILFAAARIIFGAGPWGALTIPVFAVACILGLVVMAIPIAPMGLGVGQLAFGAIFVAVGAPSESFGAAIITAFQVVALTLNLSGAFFFATYRHEIHAAEEAPA
jgi:glycosyltransferase 2 family protein